MTEYTIEKAVEVLTAKNLYREFRVLNAAWTDTSVEKPGFRSFIFGTASTEPPAICVFCYEMHCTPRGYCVAVRGIEHYVARLILDSKDLRNALILNSARDVVKATLVDYGAYLLEEGRTLIDIDSKGSCFMRVIDSDPYEALYVARKLLADFLYYVKFEAQLIIKTCERDIEGTPLMAQLKQDPRYALKRGGAAE